jgi:hypothetical protein
MYITIYDQFGNITHLCFYWHTLIIQRNFMVTFPYVYKMYFDQIYLLYYSFFFSHSPLFEAILMGFIILFAYMLLKYFNHIHPPLHLLLSPFPHPHLIPAVSSFYTCAIIFVFSSGFHRWERENMQYLSQSGSFCLTWWSPGLAKKLH